jgi:hypothetical protein
MARLRRRLRKDQAERLAYGWRNGRLSSRNRLCPWCLRRDDHEIDLIDYPMNHEYHGRWECSGCHGLFKLTMNHVTHVVTFEVRSHGTCE